MAEYGGGWAPSHELDGGTQITQRPADKSHVAAQHEQVGSGSPPPRGGRHQIRPSRPRARRCRGDGAAALVEAALAAPLLFLILFGIIDFGSLFNDYLSVRQGTREAARQAAVSTQPGPPGGGTYLAWNSSNCTVTNNITIPSDGYALICYTKNRLGLNEANTRVSIEFTPQPAPTYYLPGQGVIICTQYPASSLTGFLSPFMSGYNLTSKVEIRIEQPSTSFSAPVQETPLPGTSWPANCSTP